MKKIYLITVLAVTLCISACNTSQSNKKEINLAEIGHGNWTKVNPEELSNAIQLINKEKMVLAGVMIKK